MGSGPASLTAAWQLARSGYRVKILEAAAEPGGFLRQAIPEYRLPQEVVEQDIANVAAVGVEIVTNTRVEDLGTLRRQGYDAVLVATGTPLATGLEVQGEALGGVVSGLEFLRQVRFGRAADLTGKRVVVVGGGNVAMDAARTARRLGALETVVAYRRGRQQMPAHAAEVQDAEIEGVRFTFLVAPVEVVGGPGGEVTGLRCTQMKLGPPDASGRRRPEPVPGSNRTIPCDMVISAIGLVPDSAPFAALVPVAANRSIAVDPVTLQSGVRYLSPPAMSSLELLDTSRAVGQGRRAAHMIDRWLQGRELDGFDALDDPLVAMEKAKVLARQRSYTRLDPGQAGSVLSGSPSDFAEVEPSMTEAEALAGASRCLDCGVCSECRECVAACPADAIHLNMHDETVEFDAGAVVVATGYKLFAADAKPEYGWGRYPNVITGMQMDRLLAPTRPFNTVLRPSDGKIPNASPMSPVRARGTRPSATRSVRRFAACTRSNRTS